MGSSVSFLTQSKFFSPAFNSAIFDGPLRIYFSQHQESLAMKIYFDLLFQVKGIFSSEGEGLKRYPKNIFIMLYPTEELFERSFESKELVSTSIGEGSIDKDLVLGIKGPVTDENYASIFKKVESQFLKVKDSLAFCPLEAGSEPAV